MKFNPFKKLITGAMLAGALNANAAKVEQPAQTPVKGPEPEKEITQHASTNRTVERTDRLSFEEGQREYVESLMQEKAELEKIIQEKEGQLQAEKADFVQRYSEVMAFKGKELHTENDSTMRENAGKLTKKHKATEATVAYLPQALENMSKDMAKEYVGKADITSEQNVDGLVGVLMSQEGPLGKEVALFQEMLAGSMGSTVHQRYGGRDQVEYETMLTRERVSGKPSTLVGSANEDLDQHQALGSAPKKIIRLALESVDAAHKLEKVQQELDNALHVPPEPEQEIAQQ
jgi:hypothetical protein